MGILEAGRLPRWLNTPEKVNVFIETLRDTGSYGQAGKAVGTNKNAVSGAVNRAGGLSGFLLRAGVEKPEEAASQIRMKVSNGKYAFRGAAKIHAPRVKPVRTTPQPRNTRQETTVRRDEAAQRFIAQAETRINRKGNDPRVATVADVLQSKGYSAIPGVSIVHGRALVQSKNIDPQNPPMQSFAQIKLERPSTHAPQNDLLAASLKRDLESTESAIGAAAKKSGIQRISVAINTDRGLMPIIDRTF